MIKGLRSLKGMRYVRVVRLNLICLYARKIENNSFK